MEGKDAIKRPIEEKEENNKSKKKRTKVLL